MKVNQSILIVDDDLAHRTMLKKLLGGWGYEVFEADDGSIAIDECAQAAIRFDSDGYQDAEGLRY